MRSGYEVQRSPGGKNRGNETDQFRQNAPRYGSTSRALRTRSAAPTTASGSNPVMSKSRQVCICRLSCCLTPSCPRHSEERATTSFHSESDDAIASRPRQTDCLQALKQPFERVATDSAQHPTPTPGSPASAFPSSTQ